MFQKPSKRMLVRAILPGPPVPTIADRIYFGMVAHFANIHTAPRNAAITAGIRDFGDFVMPATTNGNTHRIMANKNDAKKEALLKVEIFKRKSDIIHPANIMV